MEPLQSSYPPAAAAEAAFLCSVISAIFSRPLTPNSLAVIGAPAFLLPKLAMACRKSLWVRLTLASCPAGVWLRVARMERTSATVQACFSTVLDRSPVAAGTVAAAMLVVVIWGIYAEIPRDRESLEQIVCQTAAFANSYIQNHLPRVLVLERFLRYKMGPKAPKPLQSRSIGNDAQIDER